MSDLNLTEPESARTSLAAPPVPTDAGAATDRASWLALMAAIGVEEGSFQPLGSRHWAFFVDDGASLLVSFETMDQIRARAGQMPLAHDIAAAHGWSHLCLIADGETWFRDPAVWDHFDRLIDDVFFDSYDRVLFYGAGSGGYAASAFAVAAPGAQVLVLNPRATQEPTLAGWDKRTPHARKLDFTSRYGYAPDMVQGASNVSVIFDPSVPLDAMHAALFRSSFTNLFRARHAGDNVEMVLANLGMLEGLIEAAMAAKLDLRHFATAWRKRRNYAPYLRRLLALATAAGRVRQQIMICRSVTRRLRAPKFAETLASLTADAGPDNTG